MYENIIVYLINIYNYFSVKIIIKAKNKNKTNEPIGGLRSSLQFSHIVF